MKQAGKGIAVLLCHPVSWFGLGLLLLAAPVLALTAIVFAVRSGEMRDFLITFWAVALYLFWSAAGIVIAVSRWSGNAALAFSCLWAGAACIPHGLVWRSGWRARNRDRMRAGIFGVASVAAAVAGFLLIGYGESL